MANNSIFEKFLDNAPDAFTLEMEISPLQSFQTLYEMMQEVDTHDNHVLLQLIQLQHGDTKKLEPIEESQQTLFNLIRNVWDIAYSYGEYDALTDNGLSITEITD